MGIPAKFSTQRVLILCIPTILLLTFLALAFRAGSLSAPFQAIKDSASQVSPPPPSASASPHSPLTSSPPTHGGFGDLLAELYKPIKLPVTADSYADQRGNQFDNGGRKHWTAPLGKDIVIVDIDTRIPLGENEVFNATKTMDWEKVHASGSGLLTVSHVNHFLYSQIHGYDYKYFHAQKMQGHYNTWIKPHVLQEMLRNYKFVVFIDADAIIQHLEVPMEFLFNRWDVSPRTSIALPIDTQQVLDGNNISLDGKGKVVLNTGVVVLQNLPHTHDMMDAWRECTTEKRYPGCGQWKEKWSHEQRAFSEYIRYDFNPQGNNIVEIPCNDANGFPGLHGQFGVIDDCKGEFIRHYTIDKNMAKTSTGEAIVQNMGELLQKNFAANRESMLIEEPVV